MVTADRDCVPAERIEQALVKAGLLRTGGDEVAMRRLSGGHSHVTWSVRQGADPRAAFVVKVAQNDGPLAPYDVESEVSFMRLAQRHGLPTPEVVHVGDERDLDAQYFVMRLVQGHNPVPREVVGWLAERPRVRALDLAEEVVRTLVAMACIRPDGDDRPVSMADHYRSYVRDAVAWMEKELDGFMAVPSTIRLVLQRLLDAADVLGDHPLSVVHGDFRFGNLMLDDAGTIVAIIDWERGMWGHPLHDLAYLSLPSMGYRGRVAGLVTDEELLATWRRVAGESIDLRALSYLRTVSIFTELCSCIRALGAYMRGRGRTSLLRILPIIARHEVDVLDSLEAWRTHGSAA